MKILILGYGRMGQWFADQLKKDHFIAVYEKNKNGLNGRGQFSFIHELEEIQSFKPDMVINAVNLSATEQAFEEVEKHMEPSTIFTDITSVKNGIMNYYEKKGIRYVSTHPMFGPTFANMDNLSKENAIIIEESDEEGKIFFKEFYSKLGLNIRFISFNEHDKLMSNALSLPFLSTLLFSTNIEAETSTGTTYQKHINIAEGLLSEDDNLISEILFNPHTVSQIEKIRKKLELFSSIILNKDKKQLLNYLEKSRIDIKQHKSKKATPENQKWLA